MEEDGTFDAEIFEILFGDYATHKYVYIILQCVYMVEMHIAYDVRVHSWSYASCRHVCVVLICGFVC